jgi:hypothetical protein
MAFPGDLRKWRNLEETNCTVDVDISVGDLGCLSRIPDPNFSIPDPG